MHWIRQLHQGFVWCLMDAVSYLEARVSPSETDEGRVASVARQSRPRRTLSKDAVDRTLKVWPVFALFPVIVVGQLKATGFDSIAGVDTTVLSVGFLLTVTAVTFTKHRQYPFRQMLPFFLFALVVLLGVARSDPGGYQSLKARDFFLLTGVIVICVPVLLRDLRDLRGLLAVWFSGGVLVATIVLMVGGAEDLYGRAGIGEATLGPAYLSAAGVVVGGAALGEKLIRAAIAVPGMVVCGVALIAIGSRGPIIATGLGLLAWILIRGVLRTRTLLVALLVTGIALVGVNRASDAAISRFVLEDEARRGLWATARLAFLEAPLLGQGWGDFSSFSLVDYYPHNLFLETASEMGILGLLALLAMLSVASVRVLRSRSQPEVRVVAALAVVMLVGQQFSSDLTNRLFWIATIPCLLLPLGQASGRSKLRYPRNGASRQAPGGSSPISGSSRV